MTPLNSLLTRLQLAAAHNRQSEIPPAAVLWTDKERQWLPLLPRLLTELPALYTLGPYIPSQRQGPAIWLRCKLKETNKIPIFYLPGVSRPELRAVAECPRPLQPLAELQYRGSFFSHPNGKDWTLSAFLSSINLDVAMDTDTQSSLHLALLRWIDAPISELQGRRLEAEDFQALLSPDFDRELLRWMEAPDQAQNTWLEADRSLFRERCKRRFSFDPVANGPLSAADLLVEGREGWGAVWRRFEEAPVAWPGVASLLEKAKVPLIMPTPARVSPQHNRLQEDALRQALLSLSKQTVAEACQSVASLEAQHGVRRSYAWAKMQKAPMAQALEALSALAQAVKTPHGGSRSETLAQAWTESGWKADHAALMALACCDQKDDVRAIHVAIQTLYRPYLEDLAEALQKTVQAEGYPASPPLPKIAEGEVVLFADGLRFDVGEMLLVQLAQHNCTVERSWRWVCFPSVTATAKPAVSPVVDALIGGTLAEGFAPTLKSTGRTLNTDSFRKLLEQQGIQYLSAQQTGVPDGKAWTEFGDIDHYGHEHGWKTARYVVGQVKELASRVQELMVAGWSKIRIVTDHGWLLLPGGLPKQEIPACLTDIRWGRCALLKPDAHPVVPVLPWGWNAQVEIAVAPGIGSFYAGTEYAHGGLTLQECVVPLLMVMAARPKRLVQIENLQWRGLRCKLRVNPPDPTLMVDLRMRLNEAASSVIEPTGHPAQARPRATGADGMVSLPAQEGAFGNPVYVVVLDAEGHVVSKALTTIGGEL